MLLTAFTAQGRINTNSVQQKTPELFFKQVILFEIKKTERAV